MSFCKEAVYKGLKAYAYPPVQTEGEGRGESPEAGECKLTGCQLTCFILDIHVMDSGKLSKQGVR